MAAALARQVSTRVSSSGVEVGELCLSCMAKATPECLVSGPFKGLKARQKVVNGWRRPDV